MAAGVATNSCEGTVEISTVDEAFEGVRLDRAANRARGAKLLAVALDAPVERARSRVARAVNTVLDVAGLHAG